MLSSGGLAAAAAGAVAAGAALYALSRLYKRSDTTGSSAKVVVVLGGQWGDEGKGKLVDILAQTVQVCARFNGGANAGHTLVVEGKKYAFHLVPCGMMNRASKNLIGNGVVVHIPTLLEELAQLKEFDPAALSRLFISDRAAVLLDTHREIDGLIEAEKSSSASGSLGARLRAAARGGASRCAARGSSGSLRRARARARTGTTKRGIGPCYASKINRNGLRFTDLLDVGTLPSKMRDLYKFQDAHYPGSLARGDIEEEIKRCAPRARRMHLALPRGFPETRRRACARAPLRPTDRPTVPRAPCAGAWQARGIRQNPRAADRRLDVLHPRVDRARRARADRGRERRAARH